MFIGNIRMRTQTHDHVYARHACELILELYNIASTAREFHPDKHYYKRILHTRVASRRVAAVVVCIIMCHSKRPYTSCVYFCYKINECRGNVNVFTRGLSAGFDCCFFPAETPRIRKLSHTTQYICSIQHTTYTHHKIRSSVVRSEFAHRETRSGNIDCEAHR